MNIRTCFIIAGDRRQRDILPQLNIDFVLSYSSVCHHKLYYYYYGSMSGILFDARIDSLLRGFKYFSN